MIIRFSRLLPPQKSCNFPECLEKSVKLCVNLVGNRREIFRSVLEIELVSLDYQNLALVVGDPFIIPLVKIAEVLDAYALFIVASSLLDL